MDGKRFRIGSVAVLLAVIVICTAILCVLTAVTAVSDARTADAYGDHVQRVYDCQSLGEQWLAQADAYAAGLGPLPEDTDVEDSILSTRIAGEGMQLEILARQQDGGLEILRWDCTAIWQPAESWNLLK